MTASAYTIDTEARGGTEGRMVRAFDAGGVEMAREWTGDRDAADDIVREMVRGSAPLSQAGQTPGPRDQR